MYLSYSQLSPTHQAFTLAFSNHSKPKTYKQAAQHPKWKEAMYAEMSAIGKNSTSLITELPPGKTTIGCKWVYCVKYKADSSMEHYKACLVAKEFTQREGVDYAETFFSNS